MSDRMLWDGKVATVMESELRARSLYQQGKVLSASANATYPIASVTSVSLERLPFGYWEGMGALALVGMTVIPLGMFMRAMDQNFSGGLFMISGVLLILSIPFGIIDGIRARVVRVGLVSGKTVGIKVPNEKIGQELSGALNTAVRTWNTSRSVPTGIADELARLADLRDAGVLSPVDWEQAKALFLGKPASHQEQAVTMLRQLHDLRVAGVLSESEFNMKKWDVLAAK